MGLPGDCPRPAGKSSPTPFLAPEEFEASLPGLYLDIALDGIVLHDTGRFLAARLARLRRLIETHGLHREVNQRDLLWRWERFPGFDWSLEREMAQ